MQLGHRQLGPITLTSRKAIGLLAYLLIESQHAHSREFLLGLLWPNLPTAAAQNNLRVTWAHLQKALRTEKTTAQPHLVSDRLTLRFNPLSDYDLDVARFRALLEACRTHSHAAPHACAACADRLTEALQLARGDFLEQFSPGDCPQFDEWLLVQREQIHIQVSAALEQLAAFYEHAGQPAEAERTIRRLLENDPLRESAYRQLMRVLTGMDRPSAALEVYETCRRVLASELGLAPAVETATLAEQIRARAPVDARTSLPPALTRFFGRQHETTRLVELLSRRDVRLVTLVGPGGVGKTRLAIEAARQMAGMAAHTICLIELASVTNRKSVDDAVAAALRLPGSGGLPADAIVDYLRDKTALLLLDNCEHVAKACAPLLRALCREAEGVTVLATSRIALHLPEEQVMRLEPFTTPALDEAKTLTVAESLRFDAVQLFANRAAQALLQFTLTDANVLAVARICQQLDGMPLAIEIAAAQARALPVEAIAERLDQRFMWVNKRTADTLPRQRTLHTLIDWSYDLLSPQARAILRRLAVFAGGWTLEAAEATGVPGEACAEELAELVEHSLLTFGADTGRRRYSMHETIRQFAQKQLRGSGGEADALARHARYYARLVVRAAENQDAQPFPARLHMVLGDHDNLRAAFEWLLAHDREQTLVVVTGLGTLNFWELGGFFQEGRRWLQQALEATQGSLSLQRGRALLAAAGLSSAISDFAYGLQCAQQAQDLFQQLGDQRGEIDARLMYCDLARHAGELAQLQAQIGAALRMAEQLAYTAGMAKAQQLLAIQIVYTTGESAAAIGHELSSVALWRQLERPFDLATALNFLGADLLEVREYAASRQALLECREIYQALGYRRGVALAQHNLGCAARAIGEYAQARELLCDALRIRQHLGLRRGYAYSFEQLAQLNEREARFEQAIQLWAAAATLRTRLGAPLEYIEQKDQIAALPRLRAQLGAVGYALAWAKGAAMTPEQAIALALS